MFDSNVRMSRRTGFKTAAVGGVGLVASGTLGDPLPIGTAGPPEAFTMSNDEWFAQRA